MKVSKFLGSQKVLNELAKMDFKIVAYAMRNFSRMQDLADYLAWAYNAEDIKSDLMDEYSKDHGLDEDWWRDEKTEEDIFWAMTE